MTDPMIASCLTDLIAQMGAGLPELRAILDAAQRGELTEQEALDQLVQTVQTDSALADQFMDLARDAFKATRANMVQADIPLSELGEGTFWSGVGLPQMNPLVEAALIERAQFDEDMPELRTGPAPAGVNPAMPVQTSARNPIAIGAMMETASAQMKKQLADADRRRAAALERVAEAKSLVAAGNASTALKKMADQDTFALAASAEFDPPGYRRGELPTPVVVPEPTGVALISMTPDEQRTHVWRFISTSQGRRTALETLRAIIFNGLREVPLMVELREYNPKVPAMPLAYHQWSVNLSGRGSMQPAFNIIDTAAKVITKALADRVQLEDPLPKKLYLEVLPVDTVDIRKVGWAARLVAHG